MGAGRSTSGHTGPTGPWGSHKSEQSGAQPSDAFPTLTVPGFKELISVAFRWGELSPMMCETLAARMRGPALQHIQPLSPPLPCSSTISQWVLHHSLLLLELSKMLLFIAPPPWYQRPPCCSHGDHPCPLLRMHGTLQLGV